MAVGTRILQTLPPDHLPGGETLQGPPLPFQTGGIKPPVPPPQPPLPDSDFGIIWVRALDGYTRNHSGASITGYDIGGVDPVFSEVVAYLYPGAAADDNDLQWEIPVPQDMDLLDPQITVILHFLIPLPPFTPTPVPGGLPAGCTDSILWFNGTNWQAALLVFDASGDLVSSAGAPVVVDC